MYRIVLIFFLFGANLSFAQQKNNWTLNSFSNFGFFENLGKYEPKMEEKIHYFAHLETGKILLSKDAFIIGKPTTKNEASHMEWEWFKIEFQGANLDVEIIPEGQQAHTFNFQNPANPDETIHAKAFEGLNYRNIYPNIDLSIELPEEGGLKYSFLVHPGGDYEQIKMHYSNVAVSITTTGDLTLKNQELQFSDHAPVSYVNGEEIESQFLLEEGIVRFQIADYDHTQFLIIDPWIEDDFPTTEFTQGCFEITYNQTGQCGVVYNRTGNDEVYVFDDAGVLEWMWDSFVSGDVDMNPVTGETYVSDLSPSGTRKFDLTGDLEESYLFDAAVMGDVWRVRYNSISNYVYYGNGLSGTPAHVTYMPPDLSSESNYVVFTDPGSPFEPCTLLEIDPEDGAVYYLPSSDGDLIDGEVVSFGGIYGNNLYKLNPLDPSIIIWETSTTHEFVKGYTTPYSPEERNGVNGIACGNDYVYTYDGNKVLSFNKATGELVDSVILGTAVYGQYGIDTDPCGDVYVGSVDSVFRFDENLNYKQGYFIPGSSRDLVIGNGKLYVCGFEYATQIDIKLEATEISIESTPAYCGGCNGTAVVYTETCADWNLESINWSPGGGTDTLATDLCPGWYFATTVWSNEFGDEYTIIDSVFINPEDLELTVDIEIVGELCEGLCNGVVTLIPTIGLAPYTYTLDGETNGIGVFEDLCAGDYDVTVVDANGCEFSASITVGLGDISDSDIVIPNNPTCYGFEDGSVTIDLTDPMGGEVIEIRNPEGDLLNVGGSNTANTLGAGWYYYLIDLGDGCVLEDSVELFDPPPIDAILDVINPPCHGDSTGVVVVDTVFNAQGDYGEIVYIWAPDPEELSGLGADSAYGLPIGDYNLIINDDNGCSRVLEFTLTEPDPLVFVELGFEPAYCRLYGYQNGNGVVYAAASGGIPDYEYEWVHLETGNVSDNSTWGGLNPGTYEITVTDEHGCELVEIIELDSLNPIAAFTVESDQLDENCEGTELVLANFVNQSQYFADPKDPDADTTFLWNLDYPKADWMISHDFFEEFDSSYVGEDIYQVCLIALNKNGCADTTCKDLIVHVKPEFVAPNIFTPGNGGANELFTFEFLTLGIAEFHCEIVNRWGVTVGEINNIVEGWDGTNLNGGDCPDGVYFYVYTAVATNKTVFTGQGTVQLVR